MNNTPSAIQTRANQIQGSFFGLAIGDSFGAQTEFCSVEHILHLWPPDGPMEPTSNGNSPYLVTDDTQMALAVAEALKTVHSQQDRSVKHYEAAFREEFIKWFHHPDNNRAPGQTCMRACYNLELGDMWVEATQHRSKGCGANMRVATVAYLSRDQLSTADDYAAISQLQAAMTHGHPTALAASDLTTQTILLILDGVAPQDLPQQLREYALSQREVYHAQWLGDLWTKGAKDPEMTVYGTRIGEPFVSEVEFISYGWDECLKVIDDLIQALKKPDRKSDPCLMTGAGWIAEEAFATGLLCYLLYPDDPVQAIRRATVTSGDSDSIACLTGSFIGAAFGINAWPKKWVEEIEYHDQLKQLVDFFAADISS